MNVRYGSKGPKVRMIPDRSRIWRYRTDFYFIVFLGAIILMLACPGCQCRQSPSENPSEVVASLLEQMDILREFQDRESAPVDLDDPEEAARYSGAMERVREMFADEGTRKVVLAALLLVRPSGAEFIGEHIAGNEATVTIRAEIGVISNIHFTKSPAKPREITFRLVNEEGRWLISDLQGVLSRAGG